MFFLVGLTGSFYLQRRSCETLFHVEYFCDKILSALVRIQRMTFFPFFSEAMLRTAKLPSLCSVVFSIYLLFVPGRFCVFIYIIV